MFSRTNNGLSSEHLFYGVDLVVYCEGEELEGEDSSFDEIFWAKIFVQNGKSVQCKSVGSKTQLVELANKIAHESLQNIVVAMDRDYDDLKESEIEHPQVFYTFGYSWESDIVLEFNADVAISAFATIGNKKSFRDDLEGFRAEQSSKLKRPFALDFKYINCQHKLFDRQKPTSIISIAGPSAPYLDTSRLLKKAKTIKEPQEFSLPREAYESACGVRRFFGKSTSRLFYHWFNYRSKKLKSSRKLTYDSFMSLLIETADFTSQNSERNEYYNRLVSNL